MCPQCRSGAESFTFQILVHALQLMPTSPNSIPTFSEVNYMQHRLDVPRVLKWFLAAILLSAGLSMAQTQTEPSLKQVYAAAEAGKLAEAQLMVQQVLISHPTSAKAFFVRSELYTRQGDLAKAREALASAEKFAPGLPFAKPEAVQKLHAQLGAKPPPSTGGAMAANLTRPAFETATAHPVPAQSSSSWALPLLLAGGAIALGFFLFRKKQPDPYAQQAGISNSNGLSGPQTFAQPVGAGPYGQPGYPNQGVPYGQSSGSGLGGRIMGGVATGLAVGAGVMAAEAIGRNLMGGHNSPSSATDSISSNDFQAVDRNTDMGGQDFGINDTSSWDDGGSGDVGGGDWDN
jgi:hypothetical protein